MYDEYDYAGIFASVVNAPMSLCPRVFPTYPTTLLL
jgi:hypothetical protein